MKRIILLLLFIPFIINAQDGVKPIIDVHLHGFSDDTYRPMPGAPETYSGYQDAIREQFKKFNIVYAVKSGGQYDSDLEEIMLNGYQSNNYIKIDTVEFKKLIDEKKIQVWGEFLPQFNGLTIADPKFAPYLKICEAKGVPIALHTGRGPPYIYKRYPKYRLKLGDPIYVEEILIKYPDLKIYLMHSGIPYYESTLALMDQYPQVYSGLGAVLWVSSGLTPFAAKDFLSKAKAYGFIDRIMFGSDGLWPHNIEESIQKLDSFEFLDEKDKRQIFYENAVRFFELDHLKNN